MSAVPDIKLDLSSLTSAITTFLIAPVAPGLSVLVGTALCHPNWVGAFFGFTPLGYYSKLIALALFTYVAGFLVWLTTAVITAAVFVATCAVTTRKSRLYANKRAVRMKLCRAYLGRAGIASLLPAVDDDALWDNWFAILKQSLVGGWDFLPGEVNLFTSLEATAFIVAVCLCCGPFHSLWIWALAIITFICALFGTWVYVSDNFDSDDLSSEILRRLEPPEPKADAPCGENAQNPEESD